MKYQALLPGAAGPRGAMGAECPSAAYGAVATVGLKHYMDELCPLLESSLMREPDMTIDGWRLTDGEELHSQYPSTFRIPPLEIRSILQPGDFAKLLFVIAV